MPAQILDGEEQCQLQEAWLQPGKAFQDVFPRLFKTRTTSLKSDFLDPANCLRYFINWLWLQVRLGRSSDAFSALGKTILCRAFDVYHAPIGNRFRGMHDLILLHAAVIFGDRTIIQRAAEAAGYAEASSEHPFTTAACGVLKARLLGDPSMETAQLAILSACKGKPVPYHPLARAAYRTLVERKPKLLLTQSHRATEKYWSVLVAEHFPIVINRTGGVRLARWCSMSYWPWPEMTLLKLSFPTEALPEADQFWLPHELLGRRTGDASLPGFPVVPTAANSSLPKPAA